MSSYSTKQTPHTACNIVVYGLLAGQLMAGGESIACLEVEPHRLIQVPYDTHANLSSFDQFNESPVATIDQQLVETVSDVYAALLQNQEALGEEFERVLYENLWELYE